MKLLVGLGNPGAQYADTRHNTGYRVVDLIARRMDMAVAKAEAKSLTAKGVWAGGSLLLAKPQTFMNASGEAVRALVDYYRIALDDLLVIYDDLDLPVGRIRLRAQGSAGGHNGMRSIIDYLHTDAFARLRVGIGSVPTGMAGRDYVLSRFCADEAPLMEGALSAAAEAGLMWVEWGAERAMSRINAPVTTD